MYARFWCDRSDRYFIDPEGYLVDPESNWGRDTQKTLRTLSDLSQYLCLVLLGEPGMGKTTCLAAEFAERLGMCSRSEDVSQALKWDLSCFCDARHLTEELFRGGEFLDWLNGEHHLHLYIDSLDECHAHIPTLPHIVAAELAKLSGKDRRRLTLRIACRTANWPKTLEEALGHMWSKSELGFFELTPLRKADVEQAVTGRGLSSEKFLYEVADRGVQPLAVRPITLSLLLDKYEDSKQLPTDRCALYEWGCRRFSEEWSHRRRDAHLSGKISIEKRLSTAAQIAAIMLFCNRPAIFTGLETDAGPYDLIVSHLSDMTQNELREVLDSGLFSGRGADHFGFAHQTYAEYLAARYVVHSGIGQKQILQLIRNPEDPKGRLVPQLAEVAAWLAGMVPGVRSEIVKTDPLAVLRTNVDTWSQQEKAELVASLLDGFDKWRIVDGVSDQRRAYRKLSHQGLAAQLEPYISNKDKDFLVRRNAIEIAEACGVQNLADLLVSLSLEADEDYPLRCRAAHAVVKLGEQEQRLKLKPLLALSEAEDPDDTLRAHALSALWPTQLAVEEVFSALRQNQPFYLGAMWAFLTDLPKTLGPTDLPIALKWVVDQHLNVDSFSQLHQVQAAIMRLAWESVRQAGVAEALAHAVLRRVSRHEDIWGQAERGGELPRVDTESRRLAIARIIEELGFWQSLDDILWRLVFADRPLVVPGDSFWIVSQVQSASCVSTMTCWIALLKELMMAGSSIECLETIFIAAQQVRPLYDAFRTWWEAVFLDSDEAKRSKASYETHRADEEARERRRQETLRPTRERVERYLESCERGNVQEWWQLCRALSLADDNTHYSNDFGIDLTVSPGWVNADTERQARILRLAERVLIESDPNPDSWLGTGTLYFPALAGCKAMALLASQAPERAAALEPVVWRKWSSTLVGCPLVENGKSQDTLEHLLASCYMHCPEEVIAGVLKVIDFEGRDSSGTLYVLGRLRQCSGELINAALYKMAQDSSSIPELQGQLLRELLWRGHQPAEAYARQVLHLPLPKGKIARTRAREAAVALLLHALDGGWEVVWPVLLARTVLSREVILKMVKLQQLEDAPPLASRLTEPQLADLFLWLHREFPPAQDGHRSGTSFIYDRQQVGYFRERILAELRDRGTRDACTELNRVTRMLDDPEWLRFTRVAARDALLAKTWSPLLPQELVEFSQSRSVGLVRSALELQDLVLEELRALELELAQVSPGAQDLWQNGQPRDENYFSDYVKRHLERSLSRRGIVALREVELWRGPKKSDRNVLRPGERTDLHVVGSVSGRVGQSSVVTVVIETKGCWNRDLLSAMKTQLVARYLQNHGLSHGIYLVGWFGTRRSRKARKGVAAFRGSLEQLQRRLEKDAAELSRDGLSVRAVVVNASLR